MLPSPARRLLRNAAAAGLLFAALGCSPGKPGSAPPGPAPPSSAAPEGRPVTLLYLDPASGLLAPCPATAVLMGNAQGDLCEVTRRYLAGPACGDRMPVFPEGTALRGLYVLEGGIVVVDLSGQAASGAGSATETARVYGLVDTLCLNFPEVRAVRLLVEGREVETLLGNVDLARPLPPEAGLAAPEVQAALGRKP